MSLSVDEKLVMTQLNLTSERALLIKRKERLENRKLELLDNFREFALNQLKKSGKPFRVRFRSINGDPGLNYDDLEMGQEFFLEYGNFTYDPKRELLTNYERTEFRETKTTEVFDELIDKSTSRPRIYKKSQQTKANATELERTKIDNIMNKKVNKLLTGMFLGEISFDDPQFKDLKDSVISVVTTINELEIQLETLNTRIEALDIINRSAGVDIVPNEPYESKTR